MRNKVLSMFIVVGLFLLVAIPAQAATGRDATLSVEGETVAVQDLFVEDGVSYISVEDLSAVLGLDYSWNNGARVIELSNEQFTVALHVDSTKAWVNETVTETSVQPVVQGNHVYIPLRFVSENLGYVVGWDDETETILLEKNEEAAIKSLFDEMIGYNNNEDIESYMSFFHKDSPLYDLARDQLEESIGKYETKDTLENLEVLQIVGDEAVVATEVVTEKISGPFMLDKKAQIGYMLKKDDQGEWKVYNLQLLSAIEYLNTDEALAVRADISSEVKAEVEKLINDNLRYSEEEDLEAYLSTLHDDSPGKEATGVQLQEIFNAYDLDYTNEEVAILDQYEDELYVYTVQSVKKISGPEFTDGRSYVVHILKQADDGTWKFYSSEVVKAEPLNDITAD